MNKLLLLVMLYYTSGEVIIEAKETLSVHSDFVKSLNTDLQNTTNALFRSLQLNQNNTKTTKIKLLTLIHGSIRNVSENNAKIYDNVKNNSLAGVFNDTPALFNITAIINNIVDSFEPNTEVTYLDVVEDEFDNVKALLKTPYFMENNKSSQNLEAMKKFLLESSRNNFTAPVIKNVKKTRRHFRKKGKMDKRVYRKFYNLKPWRSQTNSKKLPQNTSNRRIFNGKKAKYKKYPFMTSIHVMGQFMCAGSIIGRNQVITSASCLQIVHNDPQILEKPDIITIRIGSHMQNKGGIIIPVSEVHIHPNYDPLFLVNNLAVVVMKSDGISKSNARFLRRIEIYRTRELPDEKVTILGWGEQNSNSKYPAALSMAELDIYELGRCKEVYSESYVQDTNLCAGFVNVGGGACHKDLGGPGIIGDQLMGVISFGPPICGTIDAPTVFTKLVDYTEWIDSIVAKVHRIPSKPKIINFRSPHSALSSEAQKPSNKNYSVPFEISILKRLFKEYVLSGKVELKDLTQNYNKEKTKVKHTKPYNTSSLYRNHLDKSNEIPKFDIDKVKEFADPIINNTYNFEEDNIIDVLDLSNEDGATKSNSLNEKIEKNNQEFNDDDLESGGLSIDIEPTTKSQKERVYKKTVSTFKNTNDKITDCEKITTTKIFTEVSSHGDLRDALLRNFVDAQMKRTEERHHRYKLMGREDDTTDNIATQSIQFNLDNILLQKMLLPKEHAKSDPNYKVRRAYDYSDYEYTEMTPDEGYYYTERYYQNFN